MNISKEYIKMCDCPEIQEHKPKITKNKNWLTKEGVLIDIVGNYWSTGHYQAWLPRQDQIQEMLPDIFSYREIVPLTQKFAKFTVMVIQKYRFMGRTMEQFWLAFYMHEEHKKTWNGEKWLKSGKEAK